MELVSGPPLTDYARAQQLSMAGRAALIVKLAGAVQHAHDRSSGSRSTRRTVN